MSGEEVSEVKVSTADSTPEVATVGAEKTEQTEDAPHGEEEDTGAQIAPLVRLEEVAVSTGEEHENVLFDVKAKLYRFDKDGNQWKERGVGQAKLLEHKDTKRIRLLMRQQRTLKICANHTVLPGTQLQEHAGNDKSVLWHATDFSEGELKEELFTMRFGSIENMQKFRSAFEEAQETMAKLLGTASKENEEAADGTADALSSLKVGESDKKTEEAEKEAGKVVEEKVED